MKLNITLLLYYKSVDLYNVYSQEVRPFLRRRIAKNGKSNHANTRMITYEDTSSCCIAWLQNNTPVKTTKQITFYFLSLLPIISKPANNNIITCLNIYLLEILRKLFTIRFFFIFVFTISCYMVWNLNIPYK